ncbi:hypothetical protein ACGIF2_01125 [Cellulomonas sp. P22]|uniref:hypothetical protein n=1 Tax=Cellulomonas sp. P22 TaxID=3373189 RepID=UPI0037B6BF67
MLWFIVWTVLVVGTLVGAFFLGRDLWRKATALLAELGRAADVLGQLADRAAELSAAAAAGPALRPQVFDDPAEHHEELARLRRERAERAVRRAARHEQTYARWRAYSR